MRISALKIHTGTVHSKHNESAVAFVEAANADDGHLVIDHNHTIRCGSHALEATWTHNSRPTILNTADLLTFDSDPGLQFSKRPDVGTVNVVEITAGLSLPVYQ